MTNIVFCQTWDFFQKIAKLKTALILNFCNIFMKASTHKMLCFSAFWTGATMKFYGKLSIFLSHNDVCENDTFFWKLYVVCKITYLMRLKLSKVFEKQLLRIFNTFLRIGKVIKIPLSDVFLISGKKSWFLHLSIWFEVSLMFRTILTRTFSFRYVSLYDLQKKVFFELTFHFSGACEHTTGLAIV